MSDTIKYVELGCALISHVQALKAITSLLAEKQYELAIARLDQAVTALGAVVRGQAVGVTMKCPACGSEQDVVAWVDDGKCDACGRALEWPEGM